MSLHERIEHQPRLLPYLLGGLCDDIASVRQTCWYWLQTAGGLHEEDHADDLKASFTIALDLPGQGASAHGQLGYSWSQRQVQHEILQGFWHALCQFL